MTVLEAMEKSLGSKNFKVLKGGHISNSEILKLAIIECFMVSDVESDVAKALRRGKRS
jgi:hypothetical protein